MYDERKKVIGGGVARSRWRMEVGVDESVPIPLYYLWK